MGGTIRVESQPNKGSKFWFTLPIKIASMTQPLEPIAHSRMQRGEDNLDDFLSKEFFESEASSLAFQENDYTQVMQDMENLAIEQMRQKFKGSDPESYKEEEEKISMPGMRQYSMNQDALIAF